MPLRSAAGVRLPNLPSHDLVVTAVSRQKVQARETGLVRTGANLKVRRQSYDRRKDGPRKSQRQFASEAVAFEPSTHPVNRRHHDGTTTRLPLPVTTPPYDAFSSTE